MENYNTEEVWKDVVGYEGYYEVSNIGRVRRVPRYITGVNGVTRFWKGRILKQTTTQDGYLRCILSKDGKTKHVRSHVLVAESFVENPNNYPVINHKDENPANNHIDNLEWCSIAYNNSYGTRTERAINSEGFKKNTERNKKPVLKITVTGEVVDRFDSLKSAYESNPDYTKASVAACCSKRLNTYKGYFWIYEEDYSDEELESRTAITQNTQSVKVLQFDLNGNFIKEHESMGKASREVGVNSGSIHQCCNGVMKTAGNYKWEYK